MPTYVSAEPTAVSAASKNRYTVMSTAGFIGMLLLFCVPVIGWLIMLIWACGGTKNYNRRNFARSCLILLLTAAVVLFLLSALVFFLLPPALTDFAEDLFAGAGTDASLGIIGGADGPTAILISSQFFDRVAEVLVPESAADEVPAGSDPGELPENLTGSADTDASRFPSSYTAFHERTSGWKEQQFDLFETQLAARGETEYAAHIYELFRMIDNDLLLSYLETVGQEEWELTLPMVWAFFGHTDVDCLELSPGVYQIISVSSSGQRNLYEIDFDPVGGFAQVRHTADDTVQYIYSAAILEDGYAYTWWQNTHAMAGIVRENGDGVFATSERTQEVPVSLYQNTEAMKESFPDGYDVTFLLSGSEFTILPAGEETNEPVS